MLKRTARIFCTRSTAGAGAGAAGGAPTIPVEDVPIGKIIRSNVAPGSAAYFKASEVPTGAPPGYDGMYLSSRKAASQVAPATPERAQTAPPSKLEAAAAAAAAAAEMANATASRVGNMSASAMGSGPARPPEGFPGFDRPVVRRRKPRNQEHQQGEEETEGVPPGAVSPGAAAPASAAATPPTADTRANPFATAAQHSYAPSSEAEGTSSTSSSTAPSAQMEYEAAAESTSTPAPERTNKVKQPWEQYYEENFEEKKNSSSAPQGEESQQSAQVESTGTKESSASSNSASAESTPQNPKINPKIFVNTMMDDQSHPFPKVLEKRRREGSEEAGEKIPEGLKTDPKFLHDTDEKAKVADAGTKEAQTVMMFEYRFHKYINMLAFGCGVAALVFAPPYLLPPLVKAWEEMADPYAVSDKELVNLTKKERMEVLKRRAQYVNDERVANGLEPLELHEIFPKFIHGGETVKPAKDSLNTPSGWSKRGASAHAKKDEMEKTLKDAAVRNVEKRFGDTKNW